MAEKKKNPAKPALDKLRLFNKPITMRSELKLTNKLPNTDPLIKRLKNV